MTNLGWHPQEADVAASFPASTAAKGSSCLARKMSFSYTAGVFLNQQTVYFPIVFDSEVTTHLRQSAHDISIDPVIASEMGPEPRIEPLKEVLDLYVALYLDGVMSKA